MTLSSELGSLSSTLEEVAGRVGDLVSQLTGTEDEASAVGVIEVERLLQQTIRKLERLRRDVDR